MKHFHLIWFLALSLMANAQEMAKKKCILSVQTGLLGAWANTEFNATESFAIRAEVGLDLALFGGDFYGNGVGYVFAPVVNIEPRYYYNFKSRQAVGKRIDGNSGNFLTIGIGYHPDWFVLSNDKNVNVFQQVSVIPKWGIRRHIGKSNFNYEAGFGIGVRHCFPKKDQFVNNQNQVALDIHLRIGYTF